MNFKLNFLIPLIFLSFIAPIFAWALPSIQLHSSANRDAGIQARALSQNQLIKYRAVSDSSGRVVCDGQLLMTAGAYLYVLAPDEMFYIAPSSEVKFHSDFLSGGPIVSAGEISIENGKIIYINNRSGHYRPSEKQFLIAIAYLRSKGFEISDQAIRVVFDGQMPSIRKRKLADDDSVEEESVEEESVEEESVEEESSPGLKYNSPKNLASFRYNQIPGLKDYHILWIGSSLLETDSQNQYNYINTLCSKVEKQPGATLTLWVDSELLGSVSSSVVKREKLTQCGSFFSIEEVGSLFLGNSDDSDFDKMVLDTRVSYDFLKSLDALGNRRFAPMADILRILILRRHGGVYFDINKDFSRLLFRSREEMSEQSLFGKDIIINTNPVMKVVFQLDEKNYPQGDMSNKQALESFFNNDFIATLSQNSRILEEFLKSINLKYRIISENRFLGLFLSMHKTFPSQSWVFSVGGPVGFTEFLKNSKARLFHVSTNTKYFGKMSWKANPVDGAGLLYFGASLNRFGEIHHDSTLVGISKHCVGNVKLDTTWDDRDLPVEEMGLCFFSKLIEAVGNGSIGKNVLEKLNQHFDNYSRLESEFQLKLREKLAEAAFEVVREKVESEFESIFGEYEIEIKYSNFRSDDYKKISCTVWPSCKRIISGSNTVYEIPMRPFSIDTDLLVP